MANECIPLYEPGAAITAHCEAAVVGKRFVVISDPKQPGSVLTAGGADQTGGGNIVVSQAGVTTGHIFGVADRDAPLGGKVGVLRANAVVPVECGAAVTAGAEVTSDASGRAVTKATTGTRAGIALTTTTAAGQELLVALFEGSSSIDT